MCGRYGLRQPASDEWSEIRIEPKWLPLYDVRPTQQAVVIVQRGEAAEVQSMRWGLVPGWVKSPAEFRVVFNARVETAASKQTFRNAWARQRCLVPASGFYEWTRHGKSKVRHWIHIPQREAFAMAGLWESWRSEQQELQSFTVLTCAANEIVAPLHDRMPVILPKEQWRTWLAPTALPPEMAQQLAQPFNAAVMESFQTDPGATGAELMRPARMKQLELWDGG